MDAQVGSQIVARHVAPGLGRHHIVVHRGIEDAAFALGAEGGPDASQLVLPGLFGLLYPCVEIPCLPHFIVEVDEGIGFAGGRQGNLGHHLLAGCNLKGGLAVACIQSFGQEVMDGLGEADAEVYLLAWCPAAAVAIAHERELIGLHYTGFGGYAFHCILQVDDDAGVVAAAWKGEAVEPHPVGGGHLGAYARFVEQYAVIAWIHRFVVVAESVGQPFAGELYVTVHGQQTDVAQITTSGAAQVQLAEADNLLSCFMITGTPVPSPFQLVGTGTHHAKGHVGSHEYMAVVASADARVNE